MFDASVIALNTLKSLGVLKVVPVLYANILYGLGFINKQQKSLTIEELKIKIHLMTVVLSVTPSQNFALDIEYVQKNRQDYLPFMLEGLAFKYFSKNSQKRLKQELIQTIQPLNCPTRISMLYIGTGMSMGVNYGKQFLKAKNVSEQKHVVDQYIQEVLEHGEDDYIGCLMEPLGLVSLTHLKKGPNFLNDFSTHLLISPRLNQEERQHYLALMYHGLGRGIYFGPISFVPCDNWKYRVLDDLVKAMRLVDEHFSTQPNGENEKQICLSNLVAGFFWAICATSLKNADVLIDYLQATQKNYTQIWQWQDAIKGGIATNLYMLKACKEDGEIDNLWPLFWEKNQNNQKLDIWQEWVKKPAFQYLAENTSIATDRVYRV